MAEAQHPTSNQADQFGLRCRKCGHERLRVVYTRRARGGHVVRRRQCLHCGARLTTWERPIAG